MCVWRRGALKATGIDWFFLIDQLLHVCVCEGARPEGYMHWLILSLLIDCVKARGLKDPAGAKRRMEEKARAAKDLEAGGTAGAGGGMKVGD